jgi:hypothetical protein
MQLLLCKLTLLNLLENFTGLCVDSSRIFAYPSVYTIIAWDFQYSTEEKSNFLMEFSVFHH